MQFSKQEQEIFEYFNGEKMVKGDPKVLHRNFLLALGDRNFAEIVDKANAEHILQRTEGETDLVEIAEQTFKVKRLENDQDHGLTETTLLSMLNSFLTYVFDVKKNTETTPNGVPSSESSDPSVTSDGSDSGSIVNESETKKRGRRPKV